MTSVNINIIVSGLAGLAIAPEPWLATLPISGGSLPDADHNAGITADGEIWPQANFHGRGGLAVFGHDGADADAACR